MSWIVIANAIWQMMASSVLFVQFFTILWLRRRVCALAEYEYFYLYGQYSEPQPAPQSRVVRRPLRRPR